MSIKDCDRVARANYQKKVQRIVIELYPTDEDIKQRFNEIKNAGEQRASYIKRLIREDIKRNSIS